MISSQIFPALTPDKMLNCLIGDVGGTNVRLQINRISLRTEYSHSEQIKQSWYHTRDHPSFLEFVQEFLKDVRPDDYPQFAVVGIAGPVSNNKTIMANTNWPLIDGHDIGQQTKIMHFTLLNDFQAVAYGILSLSPQDLILLNQGHPKPNSVITILGPGTGLGVSRLIPLSSGGRTFFQVWPTEGGHVCFSPTTDLEIEYLQYLKKHLQVTHVVTERAFAGQAIPYMYHFIKEKFAYESVIEKDLGEKHFKLNDLDNFLSSKIFEYGTSKKDEICTRVVDMFINCFGTAIGDLVVNTLPYGGVYLFGGMINAVAPYMIENPEVNFLQEYIKNRPHLAESFEQIPIFVIKKISLGLEGAYYGALRLLEQNDVNKSL